LSAQRAVTLRLKAATDANIQITWQSQSLVPLPGLQIFPGYQIHKSRDLANWAPLGDRVSGAIGGNGKALSFIDPTTTGDQAFYRVESMVELSNTELIGEKLSNADFSCGNLFGANLFNADLSGAQSSARQSERRRSAFCGLTNADLSGADLFATKLLPRT
jgi:hypothetical protein